MSRRKPKQDAEDLVFAMFGEESEAGLSPELQGALQRLAEAVWELPVRSRDFLGEPDLAALSWAVQDVLAASGHQEASRAADLWSEYEVSGRQKSKRQEAWFRCDALFRMDIEAAKAGGWEALAATKRPEINDPSRPLLPLPVHKPESPPTE